MTILDRYVWKLYVPLYLVIVLALAVFSVSAGLMGAPAGPESAVVLAGFSATIAAVVVFSDLCSGGGIEAMYAVGVSLVRITQPAALAGSILPLAAVIYGVVTSHFATLTNSLTGAGTSLVGICAASVCASEYARREPGIGWLAAIGGLIAYYLIVSVVLSLGPQVVFDSWCIFIVTAVSLGLIWAFHYNINAFR